MIDCTLEDVPSSGLGCRGIAVRTAAEGPAPALPLSPSPGERLARAHRDRRVAVRSLGDVPRALHKAAKLAAKLTLPIAKNASRDTLCFELDRILAGTVWDWAQWYRDGEHIDGVDDAVRSELLCWIAEHVCWQGDEMVLAQHAAPDAMFRLSALLAAAADDIQVRLPRGRHFDTVMDETIGEALALGIGETELAALLRDIAGEHIRVETLTTYYSRYRERRRTVNH